MSSKDLLARYALDGKDLGKSVQRYERIVQEELRNDAAARTALEEAWTSLMADAQQVFDARSSELMRSVSGYHRGRSRGPIADDGKESTTDRNGTPPAPVVTVRTFADALSELCFLGESYFAKAFQYISCRFGAALGPAVVVALSSPSRALRLLGLLCARIYIPDKSFAHAWVREKGAHWIALCFDRDSTQEVEYALGFVVRLTDLRSREHHMQWLDSIFPQSIAYRIASMLDPADQLPTLTPQTRVQCCRVAVQVLEAFPLQATGADLVRILCAMCTTAGVSGDEMAAILRSVLTLYDDPHRRSFVRDSDIATLFVPFLETTYKDLEEQVVRMNQSKEAICKLLGTWPGLLWLASESMCLRSMVDLLHLPGPMDRKMVILNLFHTLIGNVAPHRGIPTQAPWSASCSGRRRASTQAPADFDVVGAEEVGDPSGQGFEMYLDVAQEDEEDRIPTTKSIGYFTSDAFCATILLVLEHHGLPQSLITIAKRSGTLGHEPDVSHGAAVLLQHMLVLMDHLLPATTVTSLHTAFTSAVATLYAENDLLVGTLTTNLFQNLNLGPSALGTAVGTSYTNAAMSFLDSGGMSTPLFMDDAVYQSNLKESHVEQHNEPSRWNFDVLLLLVQGPLRNPARVRWARDNTRFFTRILGFYKPSSMKSFATLRREECTDAICGLGVAIVETLLSCKEGAEMLDKAEFPKALRLMLQEVVEEKQPTILTWERIGPGATMVGQVFLMMLGRFTQSANGLLLLRNNGVLSVIQDLLRKLDRPVPDAPRPTSTLPSFSGAAGQAPPDLLSEVGHRLMQHLHLGSVPNYGVCDEIRFAARYALENKHSNHLRLCALSQLRKILWRDLSTTMEWGITRLVEALSDASSLLVEQSFRMLASICCSSVQALDHMISLKPMELVSSRILKENSKRWSTSTLLYKIAGRKEGFAFLNEAGWVQKELDQWHKTENASYCDDVERMGQSRDCLPRHGTSRSQYHTRSDSDAIHRRGASNIAGGAARKRGVSFAVSSATQNYFPLHFVAELCRTSDGCAVLERHVLWKEALASLSEIGPSSLQLPPDSPANVALDASVAHYTTATTALDNALQSPLAQRRPVDDDLVADDVGDLALTRRRLVREAEFAADDANEVNDLISAGRGYSRMEYQYTVDTAAGEMRRLKRSVLLLCNVGSSVRGFEMLMWATKTSRGDIIQRLLELAHYANTLSLRGVAILGLAVLARSPAATSYLCEQKCAVVQLSSAYVSVDGLPYSVAYAHPVAPSWMFVKRHATARGHAARNAYAEGSAETKGVVKDVSENVFALANPVNRDAAKAKLHTLYKENPFVFVESAVQRLMLDVSSMFRLRSTERKFIAELLHRSMIASSQPAGPAAGQ